MMACASRRDIQSRQSTKASHHTKRTGHKPCFFVIFFLVLWGFAPFRANARHAEACSFDGLRQQKGYPIPTNPTCASHPTKRTGKSCSFCDPANSPHQHKAEARQTFCLPRFCFVAGSRIELETSGL